MTGVVLQVSVSPGGVPNYPIDRADVTLCGIAGDGWRHPQFHGIPKGALLLIASECLDEIKAMGFPVYPGALGENLTTRGLDRHALRIGQRFRCGTARTGSGGSAGGRGSPLLGLRGSDCFQVPRSHARRVLRHRSLFTPRQPCLFITARNCPTPAAYSGE